MRKGRWKRTLEKNRTIPKTNRSFHYSLSEEADNRIAGTLLCGEYLIAANELCRADAPFIGAQQRPTEVLQYLHGERQATGQDAVWLCFNGAFAH